jgi:phosphate transport system permease protein
MSALYFATLAILVLTAFFLVRRRAQDLRVSGGSLHSLPTYHGLLAASFVLIPMLAVYAIGSLLIARMAPAAALAAFPAEISNDALRSSVALRDIRNYLLGTHTGQVSES